MLKRAVFRLIELNKYLDIKERDFQYRTFVFPTFTKKRRNNYKFSEWGSGLSLKVIKFYLNSFKKAGIPKTDYCFCRHFSKFRLANAIYYSDSCVPIVERCIYKLDLFKAVVMGISTAENQFLKIKKYKQLEKEGKDTIINSYIQEKIKERKKIWLLIEEGIKRLLNGEQLRGKNTIIFNEKDLIKEDMQLIDGNILMLHGHQFKEWVKKNIAWVFKQKIKAVSLGHYHIMLPMIRYDTLILFNGHFLSQHQTKLSDYYLSHNGSIGSLTSLKNIDIIRL